LKETHTIIIDIGNSRVKFFLGDRVFYSIEDLLIFLKAATTHPGVEMLQVDLFMVSTVEAKNQEIISKLRTELNINQIEIFNGLEQTEIKEIYDGLGNDRVAKLIGASRLNPGKNIILMDFGTATTISVLDSERNFKGGFIGLGMRSSLQALSEYCDALADYSKDPEFGVLIDNYDEKTLYENKSTKNAILLGAVNSHIALVNQWLYRGKQLIEPDSKHITICTGGEAGYFERFFDKRIEEAELLSVIQRSDVVAT